MKPDYTSPYYWASIIAPPLLICAGVIFAATYGVTAGIKNGVRESMKEIEDSRFAESIARQCLQGTNRFIRETDFIGQLSNQLVANFKVLAPSFGLSDFTLTDAKK